MDPIAASIAFWDYDRTLPIADGRVRIEGCVPHFAILPPNEIFPRTHVQAEFDISEMSLSRHAQAVAAGTSRYVGLPVFLSRSFRHASLYIRRDLSIDTPRAMAGMRIGLNNYDDTAAVVVRGLLRDQYGLGINDIEWVSGDIDVSTRPRLMPPPLHAAIRLRTLAPGETLTAELAAGRLDGLIAIVPPACSHGTSPLVRRVFSDWRQAEKAYFRETRHFPIMHVVGVRSSLQAAHPWLAANLIRAFEQAKALAVQNLASMMAAKTTLPWIAAELDETMALMGEDYWSYGLEPNRADLMTILRQLWEDGLLARRLSPQELFVSSAQ